RPRLRPALAPPAVASGRHDRRLPGSRFPLRPEGGAGVMCGIAGFVGVGAGLEALAAMATAMHHRGPDDEGIYTGPSVGLAFRRLAMVHREGGRQPMSNEDGRLRLVFNGEIYDHGPLRKLLENRGHRFVTDH